MICPDDRTIRLDLACGQRKPEGWLGIDISREVRPDFLFDLKCSDFPWPVWDETVIEARCHHFFEHLTPPQRHHFMNELWRVLKPGATCEIVTPIGYYRQLQDPDHQWPPVVPGTYNYYSRAWLDANRLGHYRELFGIRCNFELDRCEILLMKDQYAEMSQEKRHEHMRFDPDAQTDLIVVARKVV